MERKHINAEDQITGSNIDFLFRFLERRTMNIISLRWMLCGFQIVFPVYDMYTILHVPMYLIAIHSPLYLALMKYINIITY